MLGETEDSAGVTEKCEAKDNLEVSIHILCQCSVCIGVYVLHLQCLRRTWSACALSIVASRVHVLHRLQHLRRVGSLSECTSSPASQTSLERKYVVPSVPDVFGACFRHILHPRQFWCVFVVFSVSDTFETLACSLQSCRHILNCLIRSRDFCTLFLVSHTTNLCLRISADRILICLPALGLLCTYIVC
jgi:hypothetical protein